MTTSEFLFEHQKEDKIIGIKIRAARRMLEQFKTAALNCSSYELAVMSGCEHCYGEEIGKHPLIVVVASELCPAMRSCTHHPSYILFRDRL